VVALLIGLILILFAVYSLLAVPWSPGWWDEALEFLKGGIPVLAVFIGLISFFVGIADIKDKLEAKREEEEERREAEQAAAREGGDAPGASDSG
jgi:hypothetical protein